MIIGFDGSRAFSGERTGTENYSYSLLRALAEVDRKNRYVIYVRKSKDQKSKIKNTNQKLKIEKQDYSSSEANELSEIEKNRRNWPENFKFVEIPLPRFWTQIGLAYRTWVDKLDLLFVPAHTLPVLRKPGLSTLVTIHDLGYEYLPQYHQFPQKLYLNWSTEYAVKTATHLIAVSKATREDLINKLSCSLAKIAVIYEGVEPKKYQKSYSPEEIKKVFKTYNIDSPYLLFVGTLQPRKNLIRLIEAFSIVIKNHELRIMNYGDGGYSSSGMDRVNEIEKKKGLFLPGSNNNELELVIIGKKGWMYEEILEAPKKFGIEDRVKFLGHVADSDLPIFYQNALCFMMPSLFEGFGLPVLEAMAAGCPVVASKTSSLPEVVGEAGIIVDPYSVESITEGIVQVTSKQDTSNKLKERGLERVREFSWEKAARETLKAFERIVKIV